MKTSMRILLLAGLGLALCGANASAQLVFSDDFDTDHAANWTVNNNGNGVNAANFFYDYSALGIPVAPHSTGASTIGLKLSANTGSTTPTGILPGISVSPTAQSFLGNYTLKFDWWHNWLGNASGGIGNASGGSGSTQISTFGILTSGTKANYAGSSDSVFFAADGDGGSSSDYRAYSSEAQTGYTTSATHATYAAGNQNNTAALYTTLFPAGATAPAQQVTISATQSGSTVAGTAGFRWHDVEITKTGKIITWKVDGTLLATVDTTSFTVPTSGNNILLGMADTSLGVSTTPALFAQLDFTLIDNVTVTLIPEPSMFALGILGVASLLITRRRKH